MRNLSNHLRKVLLKCHAFENAAIVKQQGVGHRQEPRALVNVGCKTSEAKVHIDLQSPQSALSNLGA